MKPLLTTLIAALFLVLPLHADDPTQTISVRVIDHEGSPVSHLGLKVSIGEHQSYGRTDSEGVLHTSWAISQDDQSVKVMPRPEREFMIHGQVYHYRFYIDGSEFREDRQYRPATYTALPAMHLLCLSNTLSATDMVNGRYTLRLPPSVACILTLNTDESPSGDSRHLSGIQRSGGFWVPLYAVPKDSSSKIRFQVPMGEVSEIGLIDSGIGRVISVNATNGREQSLEIDMTAPHNAIECTVRWQVTDDNDRVAFCLVSESGDIAYVIRSAHRAFLGSSITSNFELKKYRSKTISAAPGRYVLVPIPDKIDLNTNFWAPGSVFDTLLRLRRGEELPHLKRITIPEGGTVELSSEDFLDPPADTPPQTDPR